MVSLGSSSVQFFSSSFTVSIIALFLRSGLSDTDINAPFRSVRGQVPEPSSDWTDGCPQADYFGEQLPVNDEGLMLTEDVMDYILSGYKLYEKTRVKHENMVKS